VASKTLKGIEPHILPASIGVGIPAARYERGQPVFRQGDAADAVFYIQTGKIQITVISEQGKEGVIGMLVDQLFNSSEKRLARVLLLLAHFGKDAKIETVIPKINQEILAARVGTTRSRINYFMNKFRKLGFIEYDNGCRAQKLHPCPAGPL
jgi:CRP-like cAMP-binding protein